MSQQPTQREPLTIPWGVTTLVATMSWDLPGNIKPEPWAVAYDKGGVISGQHANVHFRKTYGDVITLDRANRQIATVDLAKLGENCPDARGVSFIANLYFGPQSTVGFDGLTRAGIEIASFQFGSTTPIARHDVDVSTTDLNTFMLPLASIVREDDNTWSLAGGWCPIRYGF